MKHDLRKHLACGVVLTSLLLIAGCAEKDVGNAASSAPPSAMKGVAAEPSATLAESTAQANAETAPAKSEETEQPTEQVAETEDDPEIKDDPASKATAPLKLSQLPPRAPAGSKFKEGVHYTRLSPTQPISVSPEQVQIVEFFWYGCPHCYVLDPRVESWRKGNNSGGKADYVVFTRVPGAWSDIARFHGRFYFAAESLGKLEELHSLIFREIHQNGNPLNTIDKAREFFAAHGVDAQTFQKNFGAMTLERKLDEANTIAQRSRVTSVPTFIVNGKFTVDVQTAGGEEQLFVLLNELAAREHSKE